MRKLRDQRGVAMVTVLFVGAALTATASGGAFLAIQNLKASTDDQKAAAALSYAEAGVDQFVQAIRGGTLNWNILKRAGCADPVIPLSGEFDASGERRFDAELAVADCAAVPADPKSILEMHITSTGRHPAAKRVVRQVVEITALGLPIGAFADAIDANGSGGMTNISVVTPGDFNGREKIGFFGTDPYYTYEDFYGNGDTDKIPASAHAVGSIYYVSGGKNKKEHPPSPNCTANRTTGANPGSVGQSMWDGSGTGGALTGVCAGAMAAAPPPTTLFTETDRKRAAPRPQLEEKDYIALRAAAQTSGMYCVPSGANLSCTKQGGAAGTFGKTIQPADLAGLPNNYIFYVDFASGGDPTSVAQTLKWKASVGPCSYDPATHRSVVLIIRNGSLSMENGSTLTGAVLLPEGAFDSSGNFTTHGTIIAEEFRIRGGAVFENSACWVDNMPGPFLDTTLTGWSEIDR